MKAIKITADNVPALTAALLAANGLDENGVAYNLQDREGSLAHPVFPTDENTFSCCGDCGANLQG